jgi:hypothetical protein
LNPLRKAGIILAWRGVPTKYELSFVAKAKELEAKGLTFEEVIRATTLKVIGELPGQVLLYQIGKRARQRPVTFVKTLRRMFGKSSGPFLQALQSFMDAEKLLEAKRPYVPGNQYLVEAMIRSGAIEP